MTISAKTQRRSPASGAGSSPFVSGLRAAAHPGSRRARGLRRLAGVFVVLWTTGCGGGALVADNPFEYAATPQEVRIHVTNLNFSDATLYLLTPGSRHRLGIVAGKRSATYTVPWRFTTQIRLEIDLLASGKCTTRPLTVDPGEELELIIDSNFERSSFCR